MQELREFEKGIVSRAEEILVSGENPSSLRRRSSNARLVSSRSDLLKSSPVSGITAGPVARPVLRIQGSRNLMNASMSDDSEEDEAEQMEIQSNPMARPELKSHLSSEDESSSKSQRNPRSFPARGFGRGFPHRRPSTGKLMSTPSIPEEQEESSKSLNYSESTEIFGPCESFESLQVWIHQHMIFVILFVVSSPKIFVTLPPMTINPFLHSLHNHQEFPIQMRVKLRIPKSKYKPLAKRVIWMANSRRCKRSPEPRC